MSYFFLQAICTGTLTPDSCCQFTVYWAPVNPAVLWPALRRGFLHSSEFVFNCLVGHPLLHHDMHKVMETPPSSLGGHSPSYMTLCAQMWICLQNKLLINSRWVDINLAIGELLGCWERTKPAMILYMHMECRCWLTDIWHTCSHWINKWLHSMWRLEAWFPSCTGYATNWCRFRDDCV